MDQERNSEGRLVAAIRGGDRSASEALVTIHHGRVYRFLAHLTGDSDRADDLTQETFAAAWRAIGRFDGRSSLATWLHRIALGKFIDDGRRRRRQRERGQLDPRTVERSESRPLDRLIASERAAALTIAVQSLDEPERVVVILHHLQGMTLRQVAEITHQPIGSVKWRVGRALARLRAALQARDDDDAEATVPMANSDGLPIRPDPGRP